MTEPFSLGLGEDREVFYDEISVDEFDLTSFQGKKAVKIGTYKLADGSIVYLPCGIVSKTDDLRVCIVGGQHGNEWNGIYTAHKIYSKISEEDTLGSIFVLPILNPPAFNQKSRVSSTDNIDLNRTYVSGSYRKPTERLGKLLFENIFSKMDYVIDLHSGGPGEYLPHVGITNRNRINEASLVLPYVNIGVGAEGNLVKACETNGIRSMLIEMGAGREIDYSFVESVTGGIFNLLKGINAIEGNVEKIEPEILMNKVKIPSPSSGFFKSEVELDDYIEKGELIGRIEELFGDEKPVKSPVSGHVLYIRKERVVSEGESIVHVLW